MGCSQSAARVLSVSVNTAKADESDDEHEADSEALGRVLEKSERWRREAVTKSKCGKYNLQLKLATMLCELSDICYLGAASDWCSKLDHPQVVHAHSLDDICSHCCPRVSITC